MNQPRALQIGCRSHADFAPEKFPELHLAELDVGRDIRDGDAPRKIRVDECERPPDAFLAVPALREVETPGACLLRHQCLEKLLHCGCRRIGIGAAQCHNRLERLEHRLGMRGMQKWRRKPGKWIGPGHILRQRVRDKVARLGAVVRKPERVRHEFRHDHRVAAPEEPLFLPDRDHLLPGNGHEEEVVADPPLRNAPRPVTSPERDSKHDRFDVAHDERQCRGGLRIEKRFKRLFAFVSKFIHSVENRKKRSFF